MPVRLVGKKIRVRLGASHLEIVDRSTVVARHPRSLHEGTETLTVDHYLEILIRKRGALPGATALIQARQAGTFTRAHQRFWGAARRRDGDQGGTRALIEVLLAHRRLPAESIIEALEATHQAGITDPTVIIVEARRNADQRSRADVVPIGGLARYNRAVPTVTVYDQLLTRGSR